MAEKKRICVFTHRNAEVVGEQGIATLARAAEQHGVELLASPEEAAKHPGLHEAADRAQKIGWPHAAFAADAAMVLAGDGTLLRKLNQLRGGPPVLGVNYGMLGYLSGITHDRLADAVRLLAQGDFETVQLASLEAQLDGVCHVALNDIVASGGVTGRIIELEWRIVQQRPDGSERIDHMGVVPCDGMVMATPVGSTAYNLSNGGPVMAWGVDGYVVSFIAPHTLSARPLVVASGHLIEIEHMGRGADLKVFADGHETGSLQPGERMRVGVGEHKATLALLDDKSFYARYRDIFAGQVTGVHGSRGRAAQTRKATT